MTEPLTFVVVDDNPDARHLVRALARTTPEVVLVGEADDGESAVSVFAELQPAAALIDLHMPTGGAAVLPVLRSVAPDTCMIAWSSDDVGLAQAEDHGFDDAILKTAPWREVVDRMRGVATDRTDSAKCDVPPDQPRTERPIAALVLQNLDVHASAPFRAPVGSSTMWPCPACRERRPLEGSRTLVVSDRSGVYRNERSVVVCAVCAEQVSVAQGSV